MYVRLLLLSALSTFMVVSAHYKSLLLLLCKSEQSVTLQKAQKNLYMYDTCTSTCIQSTFMNTTFD